MAIVTEYMTKNPCYQSGRTITVKGLMLLAAVIFDVMLDKVEIVVAANGQTI